MRFYAIDKGWDKTRNRNGGMAERNRMTERGGMAERNGTERNETAGRNGTEWRNGTELLLLLLSLKHIPPLGLFRMYLLKLGHKNLRLKITIY